MAWVKDECAHPANMARKVIHRVRVNFAELCTELCAIPVYEIKSMIFASRGSSFWRLGEYAVAQ